MVNTSPFVRWPYTENTHLLCKGYRCMADLLFDWFGFDQTCKSLSNSTQAKKLNPSQSNRRSSVQWYSPLRSKWVFYALPIVKLSRYFRVGYHGVLNFTCTAGPTNNMTVAILNSNAHSHVHKHGMYEEYSPCKNFFVHRYALGIHNAQEDDLKRFESNRGYHNYVSFDTILNLSFSNYFLKLLNFGWR